MERMHWDEHQNSNPTQRPDHVVAAQPYNGW